MKYILYKIIFGDPEGAEVFKRYRKIFSAMKDIDPDYGGANFYWGFHQLGKLGNVKVTLLKWEINSTWREPFESLEPQVSGYVGSSCALFFYFADIEDTWNVVKKQIEIFFERQKKDMPVFLVVSLYDPKKNSKKQLTEAPRIQEHMEFIKKKHGDILFMPDVFADQDIEKSFKGIGIYFIKKLNKELADDFNLDKEMKYLSVDKVRLLLMAEKMGWTQEILDKSQKKATGVGEEWVIPKPPVVGPEIQQTTSDQSTGTGQVANAQANTAPVEAASAQKPSAEILKQEHVVISPEGEKVVVQNISEQQLVEFSMKGYQMPEVLKAFIPRHCPKCGNFNQRMIFERTDKRRLLMDYPRIYALKTVCGNCGCEWDDNTKQILHYEWK
jgi:hypothetical protein